MKIQLASDLHLEFIQRTSPGVLIIAPEPDADVLILPGDIVTGHAAPELFRDWPVPVLYVAGNHEFYGHALGPTQHTLRAAAQLPRKAPFHFLENQSVVIGDVRFLGATLWTDYKLSKDLSQQASMQYAQDGLNDHRRIRTSQDMFSAQNALDLHMQSRAWLIEEMAKPFDGKTVVITHHGVHPQSTHPRYADSKINAAFVSDMSDLLPGADLWVHGHVHDGFDYTIGRCRVVANPAGYILNRSWATSVAEYRFENETFNPKLVLEV
jgi:predicted phosphodiesterase